MGTNFSWQSTVQSKDCLQTRQRKIIKIIRLQDRISVLLQKETLEIIKSFPIIEKEMESKRSTLTYPKLPSLTNRNDNSKRITKKRTGSQSWLQLNRESNLWEVTFELSFEGLLKCVSLGVNWGGLFEISKSLFSSDMLRFRAIRTKISKSYIESSKQGGLIGAKRHVRE